MTAYVIYKYALTGEFSPLPMLPNAQILTAQMQGSALMLWAKAEPSDKRVIRTFVTRPTGHVYSVDRETYIATVQDERSGLVWHIFEIV